MLQYIVIIGSILQLIGGGTYVWDVLKGKAKPNRVTFFLWAAAPFIATAAAISDGVTWAIVPTFMAGFTPFMIFVASFLNKEAYWKLTRFDYMCGVFSVLALVLWIVTDNPFVAILFAIIADALAAIPTLVKAWRYPDTESWGPYGMTIIAVLLGFLAVETWSFSEVSFSIYLLAVCSAILYAMYRKRLFPKRAQ